MLDDQRAGQDNHVAVAESAEASNTAAVVVADEPQPEQRIAATNVPDPAPLRDAVSEPSEVTSGVEEQSDLDANSDSDTKPLVSEEGPAPVRAVEAIAVPETSGPGESTGRFSTDEPNCGPDASPDEDLPPEVRGFSPEMKIVFSLFRKRSGWTDSESGPEASTGTDSEAAGPPAPGAATGVFSTDEPNSGAGGRHDETRALTAGILLPETEALLEEFDAMMEGVDLGFGPRKPLDSDSSAPASSGSSAAETFEAELRERRAQRDAALANSRKEMVRKLEAHWGFRSDPEERRSGSGRMRRDAGPRNPGESDSRGSPGRPPSRPRPPTQEREPG